MMHTIRVDRVLQETVSTPYRDLVTRATGAAVRGGIERAMADSGCATALLDFSAVGLVDFSCADEVVAKLLLGAEGERYVMLGGLREDHSEAIGHVLEHHDLAVLVVDGGTPRPFVLGPLAPDLRSALDGVHSAGGATPDLLADRLGWTAERTVAALSALARLRLVRLEQGRYHPLP